MFCSQCGSEAEGNFCWSCGAKLVAGGNSAPQIPVEDEMQPLMDWTELVEYDLLLQMPEVRNLIDRHAVQAKGRMSGEKFLDICEKVLSPMTGGVSIPLTSLATACQSFYGNLGIKTGKTRTEYFPLPPGLVIVRLLCTLAENGHEMQGVAQAEHGCILQSDIPSDIWSLAGKLLITVQRAEFGSSVEAAATIAGQAFDWGKSSRCLDRLFTDLRGISAAA